MWLVLQLLVFIMALEAFLVAASMDVSNQEEDAKLLLSRKPWVCLYVCASSV